MKNKTPNMAYLGFSKKPTCGVLCYSPSNKTIEICSIFEYSKSEETKIEREIEALLSHETIHAVLDCNISLDVSWLYDNLGERLGNTPYSFPWVELIGEL